jgi:glutamyl-tRNA synthetase
MSQNNLMSNVVTRFAPSPTGFMHIGGVRTALFAYLWARKNKGTFILRIEDTDKEREVPGSIDHIQESLNWLGLEWDYGPDTQNPWGSAIQSQRLETYFKAAQILIDKGFAYPDPYSAEEIDAFRREAQANKKVFLFRDHRPKEFGTWDGKRPLRFKVPSVKRMIWNDEVRGELSAGEEALDDFILIKADGYPTYNFAHIVDDMHMGVTHVMRGDEFISSTPKFLSLYEALEIPVPKFVTLPPILREDKTKKLGKRDGAKDLLEYRTEGYLPDAMVNFLALIGWNPGTEQEIFSRDELFEQFDISKIQTHGGVFNEEKLRWFNREYLQKLPLELFEAEVLRVLSGVVGKYDVRIGKLIVPVIRERIYVWDDVKTMVADGELQFFFDAPVLDAQLIPEKKTSIEDTKVHLSFVRECLEKIAETDFTPETVKNALWDYATEKGRGSVLWPLRYALSGKERSPDPFNIAGIIGKAEAISRVTHAIDML